MSIAPQLRQFLDQSKVEYDIIEHRPTKSAMETARSCDIPAERLAKAVLLDTDDEDHLLAVLPSDRRLELSELRSELGSKPRLSDEAEVGKSLGTDLARQKMTLPLLHFFRTAPEPSVTRVREALRTGRGAESAPWIRSAVVDAGSVDFARSAAEEHIATAVRHLDAVPESPARRTLANVADYVLQRRR